MRHPVTLLGISDSVCELNSFNMYIFMLVYLKVYDYYLVSD